MRPLIAAALLAWGAVSQDGKLAVPVDKALAEAEKTIREIFKDEYAVKTGTGQQKLMKKLLEQGRETKDDATARFVLFREAAELAVRTGDVEILVAALNEICQAFQVDPPAFKESFLSRAEAGAAKPEDLKRLAETLLDLVREASELDQLDVAAKSALSAFSAAKKSKDIALSARADATQKSVAELRSAYERAKRAEQTLVATPDDPDANLAWGSYLSLIKGAWEKGLPFLAKGSDAALKGLAAKELAGAGGQIDIADGWWDLGEKEKNATRKGRLLGHARVIYEMALPTATGLTLAKLEKRIVEASSTGAAAGGPSRANRNGLVAWWRCDEGKGTTIANSMAPGNAATLMNGVDWVPGRLGKAVRFDGQTGYLSCPTASLPSIDAAQSLSFWMFQPVALTRGEDILCFSNDGLTAALQAGAGPKGLAFWKFGGGILARSASPPTPNAWHHVAFVTDGKTHSLYLDGKLENTSTTPPQAAAVTVAEFGRYRGPGGGAYYSGSLDDLRVYNRALKEAEVRGLASGNE